MHTYVKKGKGSTYSITERRVTELILVLGSQPACEVSHKPGSRLPLLSASPAVNLANLKRAGATNFAAWWTEARCVWTVCLRLVLISITYIQILAQMGSRPITFLWSWQVTENEPHCQHVPINTIWRRTESTPRSSWWRRSHTAEIYSDCSSRERNNTWQQWHTMLPLTWRQYWTCCRCRLHSWVTLTCARNCSE